MVINNDDDSFFLYFRWNAKYSSRESLLFSRYFFNNKIMYIVTLKNMYYSFKKKNTFPVVKTSLNL